MAVESKPKFGSPEWRAKYIKSGPRAPTGFSPMRTQLAESLERRAENLKAAASSDQRMAESLERRAKSLVGGRLKTWHLVLGGAAGILLLDHLIAPKGMSIASKIVSGSSAAERVGHFYTGAVNRGGFKGGAGMPFGPGPWPTQNAAAPQENGQGASRPTIMTNEDGQLEMTGWGHGEMPVPYGREHYGYSYTPWWA